MASQREHRCSRCLRPQPHAAAVRPMGDGVAPVALEAVGRTADGHACVAAPSMCMSGALEIALPLAGRQP